MLPKEKRVDKKNFEILMKDGKSLFSSLFSLRFDYSEEPKYSFSSPKKVFKKAFLRNKYKRLGFNILKELKPARNIGVFIFKKEALGAKEEDIKKEIEYLLRKAKSF